MSDYDQGWWRGLAAAFMIMGVLLMMALWMFGLL